MNAIQRLRKMSQISKAFEQDDLGALAKALDMTDAMFDDLPMQELMQIINVRLNDILKEYK